MRKWMAIFVGTIMMAFLVSTVFAAGTKVYTNKDLEKYVSKKSQETPVKYAGKEVSLDFSDASLIAVFSLISDIARQDGYTLSVDPGIKGKITLKVAKVPWDQVLDFLVEDYNLVKVAKDKTIIISPGK